MKKYFNKWVKAIEFKIDDKVLLWNSAHPERGRHSKFQKLWLGPFKIAFILDKNSYLLKDMDERLFYYSTNGSQLKRYVEQAWSLTLFGVNMNVVYILFVLHFSCHFGLFGFVFCCLFCMVIRNKVWISFSIMIPFCKYCWSMRVRYTHMLWYPPFETLME